jgi:4-hydroxybenzoate polyprenyltransferase
MDTARLSLYRFGRLSALSFSLMLPLLGAALVANDGAPPRFGGLIAIAVAFHLFAYVSNDVVDLALDRTEPLRADSPLVQGLVRPSVALTIALIQVPIAFGINAWLGGYARASLALAAAVALMLVYNVYGKRLSFPPLSDAVQSLSWVALALYGALAAGASLNASSVALAALVFVYVLLINGVHGGLRDLANDRACGARTTAIYLGARVDADGSVILPRSIVVYGLSLQLLMLVIGVVVVVTHWVDDEPAAGYATALMLVMTHLLLASLLRNTLAATSRRPDMIRVGMLHLLISLASIMVPFAWLIAMPAAVTIAAAYALPVVTMCLHDGLTWE